MLKDKKIIVGVSGGIAAYKICHLVRLFKKAGAEVRVLMTPSAVNFVSPLTLSVLSQNPVIVNMFPVQDYSNSESVNSGTWHISNGIWADLFILAPATANTIAKINAGVADNFLLSAVLAARCPVMIVPTMDEDMYENKITRRNIESLRKFGYRILDPVKGELASGLYGMGKMPEPEEIFAFADEELTVKDLKGHKILVTAGPTRQPLDPVRYISNYSSGKMGFEIAREASKRGADVVLITGPTDLTINNLNVKKIDVQTSDEMFRAVKDNIKGVKLAIMAAAVSDFKPESVLRSKIKKDNTGLISVNFVKTRDIAAYLGRNKKGFKLFGFALETENQLENAIRKLEAKNLDLIILNDPNVKGAGFGTDTNVVSIIDKKSRTDLPLMHKSELAGIILEYYLKMVKSSR